MKKELILMLVAGVVFGAVAAFIVTREIYEKKLAAAPPATQSQAQAQAQGMPGGPPQFDPDQHNSMIKQFMEKAKEPDNLQAKVMLANIYFDRGNFPEAATWYEASLKLNDKDPNVLVDLGVCYKNTKRPTEALVMFDKALALEKDKKEALFNKVVVYAFDLKDKAKTDAAMKRLKEVAGGDSKVAELEAEVKKGG